MEYPEDGGDEEDYAEYELEDGHYGVRITEFEFYVKDFEFLIEGKVLGFELVELSVETALALHPL